MSADGPDRPGRGAGTGRVGGTGRTREGRDPDLARLAARPRSAAAEAVSAVLDPSIVLAGAVLVICLAEAATLPAAVGWAVLVLVFVVGVPWLVLARSLRAGAVSDRHVVVRGQRPAVMWPAAVSVALGLLVVAVLPAAPRGLVVLVTAVLVGVLAVSTVTLVWKVSVHTAVLTAVGMVLGVRLGPTVGYAVLPLLVLLAWARWRAGRHTLLQVVAGAALGAASAGLAGALRG